ncbi:MAG: hypothetical protein M3Y87_24415, partial [Myxococcota bacterium]|nr:hypothetical protein [Myxococcota bacterium]
TAAILGAGPSATIEVRDGAGDAIAPRVPIEGALHADVARRGDAFVVALTRRESEGTFAIETRELRCESTAADSLSSDQVSRRRGSSSTRLQGR